MLCYASRNSLKVSQETRRDSIHAPDTVNTILPREMLCYASYTLYTPPREMLCYASDTLHSPKRNVVQRENASDTLSTNLPREMLCYASDTLHSPKRNVMLCIRYTTLPQEKCSKRNVVLCVKYTPYNTPKRNVVQCDMHQIHSVQISQEKCCAMRYASDTLSTNLPREMLCNAIYASDTLSTNIPRKMLCYASDTLHSPKRNVMLCIRYIQYKTPKINLMVCYVSCTPNTEISRENGCFAVHQIDSAGSS